MSYYVRLHYLHHSADASTLPRSRTPIRPPLGMPAFAKGYEAYHLGMSRIHPECSDADPLDRSVAANALLRQEPDEEEDEDEGDAKEDEDDGEEDDGYSE
jgi:hypothetical protein